MKQSQIKSKLALTSLVLSSIQICNAVSYANFNDNGVWFGTTNYNSASDFTPTLAGGTNNSAGQNGWYGGGGNQTGVGAWAAGGSDNGAGPAPDSDFGTWTTTFVNRGNGVGLSNGNSATATTNYDVKAFGDVLSSGNGYWFEGTGAAGDFRDDAGHSPTNFSGGGFPNGIVQAGALTGNNNGGWVNQAGMGTSSGGDGTNEFSHGGVTVADAIPVLVWDNLVTDASYDLNFVNDYNSFGLAYIGGNWLNGSGTDIGSAETLIVHYRAATDDYMVINHGIHNAGTFQNDVWDPSANAGAGGWISNVVGQNTPGHPAYIPDSNITINPGDSIIMTLRADERDATRDIKFSWHLDSFGLYVDPDTVTTPVPEPSASLLIVLGFVGFSLRKKR